MQGSIGQRYISSLFFGGNSADVDAEFSEAKAGTYIESHAMGLSRILRNVLCVIRGDKSLALSTAPSANIVFIGGTWINGYVMTMYRDTVADLTYVYANGALIGQHADYPQAIFDIDTNDWEMVITDNVTVPIVLNLQEMLAAQTAGELTYFDDYNYKLYSVNKPLQLNQPVFIQLEDLGGGSGLKYGSYAYQMAYASKSGESTPWGPITPYIPVPESGVSLHANAAEGYFSGLKTWGGQTELTPGRYGIRLRLRIANIAGFDYIKIKRLANQTGQPVSYTPTAEFIILTTSADGSLIDIKTDPYTVIDFVDSNSKDWAVLDESVTQAYSTIKTSRTARFYDRRIVLGGIVYESKLLTDKDIFITEPNVNRIAFPIVKTLETGTHLGFSDIYNQVYNKSHRLGERYGFGAKLYDEQGNTLFTVPLKMQESKDDFTNFQFPNRRDKIPTGVKRVDTITLSGTIGNADILCDGVTETVSFHTSLTQTAIDFVTNHAADYLAGGVIVTSYLQNIIFTSTIAGVDFTGSTSITTQASSDLTGTVVTTQDNVPPVVQVDMVLFAPTPGYAFISCTTTTGYMGRTVTYSGSDARLAAVAFVSAYAADFLIIGVTLSVYNDGGVILTGLADGSAMTTTASGTLVLTTNPVITTVSPVLDRPRIDTITFSPTTPVGAADITCGGITRTMTWDRTWYNTISTFISNYATDYLPIVVSLDALHANTLIFTGSFSEATTVLTHTTSDLAGSIYPTQPNVAGNPQIDVVVFKNINGSCTIQCDVTGGGTHSVTCSGATAAALMAAFLTEEGANHGWAAIGVSITYGGEGSGSIRITGPNGMSTTIAASGTSYDHITHTQDSSVGTAQIDTLTFTGTVGNAIVSCAGLSRSITFDTSLTNTATKFYNDYAASFAAVGVSILNSGVTIILTALNAGTGFTTTITNAPHTLTGVPVVTQSALTAVAQVDVVTLLGLSGTANITCQGLTHSVTFSISLDITAINFCTNFATEYLALKGVTVTYSGGTIIFTGPADGTAIVTAASGSLVDNIYTTTPNALGVAQIDKVTITGTTGNAIITCDLRSKGITYTGSPTDTATRFVSWYASAYAPEIQVTSVGADIFFQKLLGLGTAFRGSTTIVNTANNLTGTVEYTRANASGGGELDASTGTFQDSTVNSWNGVDVDYVYDPVSAKRLSKIDGSKVINISDVADTYPYNPVTPTGRGPSANENNYDDIVYMNIMNTVDTVDNNEDQYGRNVSTAGLRIGGIDTTKLPSNVKSFSIVRTPAAGRVVCQGIGIYALTEQVYESTSPSLVKALNKLWFYSPEIDSVIGTKSGVYEDIKANPSNYQIQLVAPCGFFSDFYNSMLSVYSEEILQDFVSMPICGAGANARPMFPPDSGETNYISFGKWRNTIGQGAGIDSTLTFTLSSAQDVPHAKIRVPYLELTLASDIYYSTDVESHASSNADAKAFHEPWYIINIIQNKEVPNNNVNSYNDIGHSIRLESIVGISNGQAAQQFPLVEERREDVLSTGETASTYRYIWVDGKPWLESHSITAIATHLTAIEAVGYCTPSGGLQCYGIFTLIPNNIITFDQILPSAQTPIVPDAGAKIVVKYNNNSPIEVFLGDTYVADASFLAIDGRTTCVELLVGDLTSSHAEMFRLAAPMPHFDFTFKTSYHQTRNPKSNDAGRAWDDVGTHSVGYIRQWLIYFTCESTVNLPLAYKNFFPNRLYAMRPAVVVDKLDSETLDEYFTRMHIYSQYNDDYPNEYLNWRYGGFSTPASVNFDYEKILPLKSYAEPQSGVNEFLSVMKRLHWGTERIPGFESNRVFLPTNIYDLKNDRASQISIIYDQYSDRGSNLYVITDHGAGMLLVNKQMITTAEGNNLTILANDSSLIKGEVWLSNSIGCPGEFWRGKSEGSVKLPNNLIASILVFPSQDDIVMLTNNSFIQIADNNRQAILASLEAITDSTKLYSVINEGENKMLMNIGSIAYIFNYDVNNWDGTIKSLPYDKSFNARYLVGSTDKNMLIHAVSTVNFGLLSSHKGSDRFSTMGDLPYVVFSVTPELGRSVDFIDVFISSSAKPYSIQFSVDKLFTESVTVLGTSLVQYGDGLYNLEGIPRTALGNRMQGKTLFVKIVFPDTLQPYSLKMCQIGFKNIEGN